MGMFTFFKSLVNDETLANEIIRSQEKAYSDTQKLYPDADQHDLLVLVWLSRKAPSVYLRAISKKNMTDEEKLQFVAAYTETMQFACVQPPRNVRALGLYFIYKECPSIIGKYPKYMHEFMELMTPVFTAWENGNIEDLYKKFNKNYARNVKEPEFVNFVKELMKGGTWDVLREWEKENL